MDNPTKWIKIAFATLFTLVIFNVATFFYGIFGPKGPSATDLINTAMDSISTAIVKIDEAKQDIKKVYKDLDSTQTQLVNIKGDVKEVHNNYNRVVNIAKKEIEKSSIQIQALRLDLQREEDSLELLKMELRKLE